MWVVILLGDPSEGYDLCAYDGGRWRHIYEDGAIPNLPLWPDTVKCDLARIGIDSVYSDTSWDSCTGAAAISRFGGSRPTPEIVADRARFAGKPACDFDSVGRHQDPIRLVQEWADLDRQGGLISPGPWEFGAVSCVSRATTDSMYVTSRARVTVLRHAADTLDVAMRYRRYFAIRFDSSGIVAQLEPGRVSVIDTARVVRIPGFGWRIDRISRGVHISLQAALDSVSALGLAEKTKLRMLMTPSRSAK